MPRKRRVARSDKQAESYLGSVSDLMAGLVFIFIITLAAFALRLAQTTADYTSAEQTRKVILEELKTRLENRGVKVEVRLDQGLLRLTEKGINFPPGQVQPRSDHYPHVAELARVLVEVLPCYVANESSRSEGVREEDRSEWCVSRPPQDYVCQRSKQSARIETLLIEGHTDTQRVGSAPRFRNNLELSSMRAAEILQMMVSCEPELESLKNTPDLRIVSVSGYGATRLERPDDGLSEENRRIDLRFLMELPRSDGEPTPGETEPPPLREVRDRYEQ